MVTFVPFAQRMVNKIGIYFLSDGLFFFFPFRYNPPGPHHGNVSDNPIVKGGLSEKIR